MRKTALIAIVLLVAATTLTIAQRPEDPDVVLKAAMTRELVDGDLTAAIARYRDIATRYRTSAPPVAARALVQMAATYEKLGRPEARATYEEIVRDFAGQREAAAVARARLGGTAQASETDVIARRIWSGPGVSLEGMPSADGRYLTAVAWTDGIGDVAIRNLTTGETRLLTKRTPDDEWPRSPVLSPDGTQVAYGSTHYGPSSETNEIRLVGIDGTRDRALLETRGFVQLIAWSPDGRQLAVTLNEGQRFRIALVSISDRTVTPLISTEWRFPTLGGFSPDGRFLVYSVPHTAPAIDGGVFAIAADGHTKAVLVQSPNVDRAPRWTPDGSAIVFLSNRSGSSGLWLQTVENGAPRGEPRLLRTNIETSNMGFTRDWTYFYGADNFQSDVYVTGLNPDTLEATTQPTRLSDVSVGENRSAAWSRDGRSIAFVRTSPRPAIVVRSVADGTERTLPTTFPTSSPSFGPEWFPDGQALVVGETDFPNNKAIFRRVEVETGRESVLFETRYGGVYGRVQISLDGRSIYYSFRTGGTLLHLMRRDLATGVETDLYQSVSDGVGFFGLTLSPDGRHLAFNVNVPSTDPGIKEGPRALMVMSVDGGTPRALQRGDYDCPQPRAAAWTKDSRYVLTICRRQVWANPLDGGEGRPLDVSLIGGGNTALEVSLDGRRLAFTGQRSDPEVWVIRNLLPAPRGSQ